MEVRNRPICGICEESVNVWDSECIVDAYQKGGVNHYKYVCPDCDVTQGFSIPIEDYTERVITYKGFITNFLRAMVFG